MELLPEKSVERLNNLVVEKLSPCRGSSDSVYSSDFETLCEETASEQSFQNICELVGLIHQSHVALIEHFAKVQELILNQFITDISVEEISVEDLSPDPPSTYGSCSDLKRAAVSRPMSKRMLDFLELITSISFADTALSDDCNEYETVEKETIFISFCKNMQHVIDEHYIPRCYQLRTIYEEVTCESTGYVSDLIESLTKSDERVGELVKKNNNNLLSNFRLVSMKNSGMSAKCYPDFYMLNPIENSGAYGENAKNHSLIVKNNPLGTVCHTMVVNLQLLRDSRAGFNCSPKNFPRFASGRRRKNRIRNLCSPGRPLDFNSSEDLSPMENPIVQRRHCNGVYKSAHEPQHSHTTCRNRSSKIKSPKYKNYISYTRTRDHTALLFSIYVITFVLIFSCFIVNYKCE